MPAVVTKPPMFKRQLAELQSSLRHSEYLGSGWSSIVTHRFCIRDDAAPSGLGVRSPLSRETIPLASYSGELNVLKRSVRDGKHARHLRYLIMQDGIVAVPEQSS